MKKIIIGLIFAIYSVSLVFAATIEDCRDSFVYRRDLGFVGSSQGAFNEFMEDCVVDADTPKTSFILDSLLNDTTNYLKHQLALQDIMQNKRDALVESQGFVSVSDHRKMVKESEVQSTISLLGECTEACLLSRMRNPHYRQTYEQQVSSLLLSRLQENKKVTYTSFGSGGSFQDLAVLAKTLKQNPRACIDIHLIDVQYAKFVALRDLSQNSREITVVTDAELYYSHALAKLLLSGEFSETPSDKIRRGDIFGYVSIESLMLQFINFLKNEFSQSHLSLTIHCSTDEYLQYINDHEIDYPDVISAADLIDEFSLFSGAIDSYVKLCITTFSKKPESQNIWLDKDAPYASEFGSFSFISQQESEGAQKITQESDSTPFYLRKELI